MHTVGGEGAGLLRSDKSTGPQWYEAQHSGSGSEA